MIPLYTQRTFGSKPRINDEITLPLWKGIVAFLEKMEQKNFFADSQRHEFIQDFQDRLYDGIQLEEQSLLI